MKGVDGFESFASRTHSLGSTILKKRKSQAANAESESEQEQDNFADDNSEKGSRDSDGEMLESIRDAMYPLTSKRKRIDMLSAVPMRDLIDVSIDLEDAGVSSSSSSSAWVPQPAQVDIVEGEYVN